MKIIKISYWLGLSAFLMTLISFVQADISNPYGVTTEDEFGKQYVKKIKPYWLKNGVIDDFKAGDGITISYIKFEIENEKAAVVISTGRTESYIKYQELVYDLTQNGYSVYLHDHRGQGFSERLLKDDPHKGHVDEFDDYVDDLHKFVSDIVLAKSHKKKYLLAHSMGAGIATRYIEKYPNTFDAAALSSPMHAPDARILVSPEGGCLWFRSMSWLCGDCYAGFTEKPYTPQPFDENEYTHSKVRYDHLLKVYSENKTIQLGGPTRRWAKEACTASKTMKENAGSIKIPVLVLQAGKDTAVTPEGQNNFCKSLKEQTGRSCYSGAPVRFDEAYHELFIESDDYRVPALTKILDFFENLNSSQLIGNTDS